VTRRVPAHERAAADPSAASLLALGVESSRRVAGASSTVTVAPRGRWVPSTRSRIQSETETESDTESTADIMIIASQLGPDDRPPGPLAFARWAIARTAA
jgi:hypothetical protein